MNATPAHDPQGVTGDRTDLRNAERLIEWYGSELRYVGAWKKWLAWDGSRWRLDDAGHAHTFAKETARRILGVAQERQIAATSALAKATETGNDEARTKAEKAAACASKDVAHAIKSQAAPRIAAMLTVAQSDPAIVVVHAALDSDPMLLNVANGTIDLRTGKLRDHDRADLITKLAPVVYDPAATCPTWDAFLTRAMANDTTLVDFLARVSGYALTGDVGEHVLAFLFGGGANGKSTYLSTLHAMLGDYATPAPRGLLFRARGDRHPTEYASLHGRRFVTCSEIEEGQAFDEALVKDLTGGDPIECRRMKEDFWSFAPTHKLFMAGNHKPTVRGDDEGIWRRVRLVPWTVTIPEGERDTTLPAKLRAELAGILAWAVRGCLAWRSRGLDAPAVVRVATSAYRDENDVVGQFFRLHVVFEPAAPIARKALRDAYAAFCEENGAEPLGAKRFAARLREQGVTEASVRAGTRVVDGWRGVRLATDVERTRESLWGGDRRDVGTCSGRDGVSPPRETSILETTPNIVPTKSLLPTASNDDPDDFAGYLKREGVAR
jgi:putative DNA primase/helicase